MTKKSVILHSVTAGLLALGLIVVQQTTALASNRHALFTVNLDDANQILKQTSLKVQRSSDLFDPGQGATRSAPLRSQSPADTKSAKPSRTVLSTAGKAQVLVSSGQEQKRPDRTIVAPFAHGNPRIVGETAVYSTDRADKKLYVRSTPSGSDIFVALGAASADMTSVFQYDLPAGSVVGEGLSGFKNFYSADGNYLGSVKEGIAKDASGTDVPTSLNISSGTLVQSVHPKSDAVYPMAMAAPSWVYNFEFPLGNGNHVVPFDLLHTCFNCYFPIPGATATYPYAGQIINLKLSGLFGAVQVDAPVQVGYSGSFYFQFTALGGGILMAKALSLTLLPCRALTALDATLT